MQHYIICYDICNSKRLQKIHKTVVQYALPLQYSVYYARLSIKMLEELISKFNRIINVTEDDIRIYPVSSNALAQWPKIGSEGDDRFLLIT